MCRRSRAGKKGVNGVVNGVRHLFEKCGILSMYAFLSRDYAVMVREVFGEPADVLGFRQEVRLRCTLQQSWQSRGDG
jgi:hypothetical protein